MMLDDDDGDDGDVGDARLPHILEPRPAPTFCSLEQRMLSF